MGGDRRGYDFTVSPNAVSLWINPAPSSFGAASEPATGVISQSTGTDDFTIDRFNLRQNTTASVPAAMQWDELRIGTSWAAVTPPTVPIPINLTGPARLPNGSFQFSYTNSHASLAGPVSLHQHGKHKLPETLLPNPLPLIPRHAIESTRNHKASRIPSRSGGVHLLQVQLRHFGFIPRICPGNIACICVRCRKDKVRCARSYATRRRQDWRMGIANLCWFAPGNAGHRGIAR